MSFQTIDTTVLSQATLANTCSTILVQRRVGAATHVYVFFVTNVSGGIPAYRKSVDGGQTFAAAVNVHASNQARQIAIWYSSWTPSDSGTLLHILTGNPGGGTGELRYYSLDLSTDTAGGTDNVQINNTFNVSFTNDGSISFCKATNGELFASISAGGGPAGLSVWRSTNAGAAWTDITGGGLTLFGDSEDVGILLPLITDDDVIWIGYDSGASELRSCVFDNALDTWETSVLIESGPAPQTSLYSSLSGTLDKTTGDLFIVYVDDTPSAATASVAVRRYDQTARTWGAKSFVTADNSTFGRIPITTFFAVKISRDQTDGVLMVTGIRGTTTLAQPWVFLSSNDGQDWGDGFYVPKFGLSQIRSPFQPTIMLDQNDGWFTVWYNLLVNPLQGLAEPIDLEFFSGTTFNNVPPATEANVTCIIEQTQPRRDLTGLPYGKQRPVHGVTVSDGSGAFKCAVIPRFPSEPMSETYLYQAQFYKQGGSDATDKMDLSDEEVAV
jgi:hypothetical protein